MPRSLPDHDEYGVVAFLFDGSLVTGVERHEDGSQAYVLFSANAGEQITEHIRRQTASLADYGEALERVAALEDTVQSLHQELMGIRDRGEPS